MSVLRKALAFVKRDVTEESSYKLAFLLHISGIFFQIFAFFFLSKLIGKGTVPSLKPYGGDYFSFVLVGIAFAGYHLTALSGFASSIREAQVKGTLEAVLLTQTGIRTIVLCSSLYRFLWTSLTIVVYLLIGAILFGVTIGGANLLGAILVLVLTIASSSGLGIISASFVMVFKRGDPLAFAFSGASFLLGGVYYPVAVLPHGLQKVSYVLPLRHSLEGMRLSLLKGAPMKVIIPNLLALAGLTVILVPIGLLCFQYAVRRAKMDGSLTHY